jgi:histidine ammonia-lyase
MVNLRLNNCNSSEFDSSVLIDQELSWKTLARASMGLTNPVINLSSQSVAKIKASYLHLKRRIEVEGIQVYGVTTGFGDNAKRSVASGTDGMLQENLLAYLDCAFGDTASARVSRATLLLRINCFAQGYSAVSPDLVETLIKVFNAGYAPVLPLEGSLGASGDLIPLASIGRALQGEGSFYDRNDRIVPAREVLSRLEMKPFPFRGKDALGLVNGTSMMTAISALVLEATHAQWDWIMHSVGASLASLRAHPSAFSPLVNSRAKRHEGQSEVARLLTRIVGWTADADFAPQRNTGEHQQSLQDSYALRCTPQVLGPCWEVIQQAGSLVNAEINSANDNPLVDPDTGAISSGGNFYGGSIAQAMDQLAWANAHIADLLDRQILLLVSESASRGLPPNLSGAHLNADDPARFAHHGMKGLHQYATSLTAEIVRLAVPASIFSRSTESHNQDKISLGTHSAKNALRSQELLRRLVTLHLACSAQALELAKKVHGLEATPPLQAWLVEVRTSVQILMEDRSLAAELKQLEARIVAGGVQS